jgi:hypothetical protein
MLTPEQERRAAEVFEALFDLDGAAREMALAAHAQTEPEVASRVRELLAAVADFEHAEPFEQPELPQPGDSIGPYHLDEQIGRGGYGVVFRASRQIGEARSTVAIKFLDAVIAGDEMRRRFDLEREVLAGLDHRSIARMLDGGTTQDGVPYLVMELVDGKPIDEYCDRHGLNVRQRLELFLEAAEAVEYAHRRQLLHRDLKPQNILVDGQGNVKVLDFGIAKLLSPRPGALELSRKAQSLFSLSHASPEQLTGDRQTVGTDIFSLGVILYQLLCGHLPFRQETRDLVAALELRQRQPSAPSSTTSGRLQRILKGDLDAIVLTALRTRPSDRYLSIDALRLDIERFLGGWPVDARPLGAGVRLVRWARRNPATSVVLAAALVLMAWGLHRSGTYFTAMATAQRDTRETLEFTRHLMTVDFATLELGMDAGKEELVRAQVAFLKAMSALPVGMRVEVEREMYAGYQQAARADWDLDHGQEAEALATAATDGFAALLNLFPVDRQLKRLYAGALRQRIEYRSALGMQAGAAADRTRLIEVEASYDRTPE